MKILQINNNHFRLGGAETVYINTLELLKEKNHNVISFSRKNSKTISLGVSEFFIDHSESLIDRFYSRQAAQSIKLIIEKERPQIVHLHSVIGGITFSILPVLKKYKLPVIITLHDFRLLCPAAHFWNGKSEVCEQCKNGKYYNCIINNCSPEGYLRSVAIATESYLRDQFIPYHKYIDKFIFVSKFSKQKFLSINPQIESKSYVIYNFTKKFEQNSKMGNYFLFFGRLEPEKGIETLLSAFKNLPNLHLKIAGTGSLLNKIKKINLPNVDFVGHKDKTTLTELIKNSSFVITPSECYENNPMSIVESFALGKPVIGSNLGGIIELVEEGITGFKFEHRNKQQLINVINRCSKISENEYANLSNGAFQFAMNNFEQEIYYSKLINVYEDAIGINK